jgi:hypothetical protein
MKKQVNWYEFSVEGVHPPIKGGEGLVLHLLRRRIYLYSIILSTEERWKRIDGEK